MSTIPKAALMHKRLNVAVIPIEFFWLDIPDRKLADARCVREVAARVQLDQFAVTSGMRPFLSALADFPNRASQSWLDEIEQAGFTDAGWPGEDGNAVFEHGTQIFNADAE